MKKLILLLLILTGFIYGQSKEEIINNLRRGGNVTVTTASPDSSYHVLIWNDAQGEVRLVTVQNLGGSGAFDTLSANYIYASDGIDFTGADIILQNDEQIQNGTDGSVIVLYNDSSATLGGLFYLSSSVSMADSMYMDIIFEADDDSSGTTNWTVIRNYILDASDESEDSEIKFYTYAAGTQVVPLRLTGANTTFTGTITTGTNGSGTDVTFYSATSDDLFLWDASEEGLYITGTAGQDALDIVDGNVDIADDIDVDGTTNLDVTDIDGAVNVGADITVVEATPIMNFIDSDGNSGAGALVADTSAIVIESNGEPSIAIYASDGDLGTISITTGDALTVEGVALIVNEAGADHDFRFETDNEDSALVIDGGSGLIYVEGGVQVGRSAAANTGDVTFYSATVGDLFLWDASEEGLYITGTAGQDALDIVDGNVDIDDDIDVNGTTNLDVVDIDGAVNISDDVTLLEATPILNIADTDVNTGGGAATYDSSAVIIEANGVPAMNWYGADGDAWVLTMNTSDQVLVTGASGGFDIDGDFTAGTITSDAGLSGTTGSFTGDVTLLEATPLLNIADSDANTGGGAATYDSSAVIIEANGEPTITVYSSTGLSTVLDFNEQDLTPTNAEVADTNVIRTGVMYVDVSGNLTYDANDFIVLPAIANVPVGFRITIVANSNGNFELRTPAGSNTAINNVDADGSQEYLVTDANTVFITKVSNAYGWEAHDFDHVGAIVAAHVPD